MTFMERLLRRPHAIVALTLLSVVAGALAYKTMPTRLFPDVARPTVAVISRWPGAAAHDVATDLTHLVEVRLSALDDVRRVTSTSRDEVSAVQVEFEYGRDIDSAANAATTELGRVRGSLPEGVLDPLVLRMTEAAQPLVVLAVRGADGSGLNLGDVRRIAENPLRDRLLNVEGVADVEVFGGSRREVTVAVDRDRLRAHGLTIAAVAAAIRGANISLPAGLVHDGGQRYLLSTQALAVGPDDLAAVLVPLPGGDQLRVGDLGDVSWGESDATSYYRGNGQPCVAVSLLRSEHGHARAVITEVGDRLPEIQAQFPMLSFEIADTQQRLIDQTVDNMLGSLRDALVMTLIVILLFLGNSRAAFITALSIPFTYLLTFAALRLMGFEFHMVTLTAVIIAVGLLADDAIVVIENIERRMRETGESGIAAAAAGTREILLADVAGTISTIVVLVPIMFIGGFVQNVLRPLSVTLAVSLAASLIVSVTIIPVLVPLLLRPGAFDPLGWLLRPFERFLLDPLRRFYVHLVTLALRWRWIVLLSVVVLFATSLRQMPLLGRELMPVMDTGAFSVRFEAEPDTDTERMTDIAAAVDDAVRAEVPAAWLLSSSTIVGSEAGVRSFGAARVLQQGESRVNIIDRFSRDRTIADIERGVRARVRAIPGLISANVVEFGATPLSSLRASVDVMITGPDPLVLDVLADDVMHRLRDVRGLTGTERTWQGGSGRIELRVDPSLARVYGLTAGDVAQQVSAAVRGTSAGGVRVPGENPIPILVRAELDQRARAQDVAALWVRGSGGESVPVMSLASVSADHAPTAETHEALSPTIDVLGFRREIAITHLHDNVAAALEGLELPRGYRLTYEGELQQMNESFRRLLASLALGLVLLFVMLVITFHSFVDATVVLFSLPLALIGGAWAMLFAAKHGCLPSFMGFILLMGVIVNNGILLVDVTREAVREGMGLRDALRLSVERRTRPILMTAFAAAVGMIPIAMEWAVGIERLSPLAVVAIGGLLVGTFLTLVAVPVFYDVACSLTGRHREAPRADRRG